VEAVGEFGVAEPAGDQSQDLEFAWREFGEVAVDGGRLAVRRGTSR
jgi:hypothetical protein